MSGNKIGVRTLDLNVECSGIREQPDEIEERHFAYAKNLSGVTVVDDQEQGEVICRQ